MTLSRRSLITGLVSLVAAPAIVRAGILMPVKSMVMDLTEENLLVIASERVAYSYIDRRIWWATAMPERFQFTSPGWQNG